MIKYILIKKHCTSLTIVVLILASILFAACEENDSEGGAIAISKVFLEDVNSSVPDRQVNFGRLGQLLRIEGYGFAGLKKAYINGYPTYFNPVYVTDNSMLISISADTPTVDADESVRNTIRLANDTNEVIFSFEIRSSAPTITSISNTLPNPGEEITVYGTGLIEVNKVVFPGNIAVTNGISYDEEDGEFFMVTVPEGVSENGGSLFIESANGGAYSPSYFNFKKGVILDFDGNGVHGFWDAGNSMIKDVDIESTSIGVGNVSQGIYAPHRPSRIASFAAATNRNSEVWTAGNDVDNWRSQITPFIAASTPLDQVAFQFDIYVPEPWANTGYLQILLINNFNGGEWSGGAYNYVPWIVDGKVKAFQTNGWTTVTVPFTEFYNFSDGEYTFEDLLAYREGATYKNFGIFFNNSDIKLSDITGGSSEVEFASAATSVNVYTDNWRIVSLEVPTTTDFPE
ncbi:MULTISPECIES: glycan-binding surface protein [Arenibacter]|uniref:glycan-binding surface protein n=1 Tax=Arenibacter TaxID=178469 RepID=UPI00068A46EC|nr:MULTISPECIES: glycan-binding surface protein [Arenibacter]GBF20459.1 hypothetical protein C21_02631 [Arenibacter sp. NBRC 103722]